MIKKETVFALTLSVFCCGNMAQALDFPLRCSETSQPSLVSEKITLPTVPVALQLECYTLNTLNDSVLLWAPLTDTNGLKDLKGITTFENVLSEIPTADAWRLPTIKELSSLLSYGVGSAIPSSSGNKLLANWTKSVTGYIGAEGGYLTSSTYSATDDQSNDAIAGIMAIDFNTASTHEISFSTTVIDKPVYVLMALTASNETSAQVRFSRSGSTDDCLELDLSGNGAIGYNPSGVIHLQDKCFNSTSSPFGINDIQARSTQRWRYEILNGHLISDYNDNKYRCMSYNSSTNEIIALEDCTQAVSWDFVGNKFKLRDDHDKEIMATTNGGGSIQKTLKLVDIKSSVNNTTSLTWDISRWSEL